MKKKYFWIRLIVSGGLIAFLFYSVDFSSVATIVSQSNIAYIVIAILIALGDRVFMAYKWNILLRAKAIRISLVELTGTYLTTTFLGLFLPATVGGDALRAYAVSKDGHNASDVISSIIVERALGFIALFVFVLAGIILSVLVFGQSFFPGIWNLFWLFLGLFVFAAVLIHITLNWNISQRLADLFARFNIDIRNYKIIQKLEQVYRSYQGYRNKRVYLVLFLLLSLVENLFPLFWTYSLALAFNINVPLLYFFILIPIVLVLVRLPISLDGIGIQEGAFVYFLTLIGVTSTEALLLGVTSHLVAIVSVLPGGVLYGLGGLSPHRDVESKQSQGLETSTISSQEATLVD